MWNIKTSNSDEQGFSLLELVVAVGVAGIIAAIAMPTFSTIVDASRTKTNSAASSYNSAASDAEAVLNGLGNATGGGGVAESSSSSAGPTIKTYLETMMLNGIWVNGTLDFSQIYDTSTAPLLTSNAGYISWGPVYAATGYRLYYMTDYNNPSSTLIATQDVVTTSTELPTNVLNTIMENQKINLYYGGGLSVFVQVVPYNDVNYGAPYTVEVYYQMSSRWTSTSYIPVQMWYLDYWAWDNLNMWYGWNSVLDYNCQPVQPGMVYISDSPASPTACYNPNYQYMLSSVGAWQQGYNMIQSTIQGSTQQVQPYNNGYTYTYITPSLWVQ